MKLSEMSNKELEDEFISYDEMVNKTGCYGTKDLMWLHAIEKEIERRGGEVVTSSEVSFPDEEDDDDEV